MKYISALSERYSRFLGLNVQHINVPLFLYSFLIDQTIIFTLICLRFDERFTYPAAFYISINRPIYRTYLNVSQFKILQQNFHNLLITRCPVIMFTFFLHFIPLSAVPRDYQKPPYRTCLIVRVWIPLSVAYRLQVLHCCCSCQTTKMYRRLRGVDCY